MLSAAPLVVAAAMGGMPSVTIAPGVHLPLVSLGTGSGQHGVVANATAAWLRLGGTAIDTAYIYNDETQIGAGIAASGVSRKDIFITTKVPCGTYDESIKKMEENLRELNVTSVNLTIIHFPECFGTGSAAETWRALEDVKAAGKSSAIGVSNFSPSQLRQLQTTAKDWPPAINQCSLSVGYHDNDTIKYCDENKITYMGYSPLCGGPNGSSCRWATIVGGLAHCQIAFLACLEHGSVMSIPQVQAIAASHNVSAAQIALKWIVQQGRPLATAVWREDYMKEDLDLWSWGSLTAEEMATLTSI